MIVLQLDVKVNGFIMKRWIKNLLGFGNSWICSQCDTYNESGRWYCGLCGRLVN